MSNKAELNDNENKAAKRHRQEQDGAQKESQPQQERDANVSELTHLQQTVGNQAVQAMMVQRKEVGEVSDETAAGIKAAKGGGDALPSALAKQMGDQMGADFSKVRVHDNSVADNLANDIGARAFTSGNDIFFKKGEYKPDSSKGQELIAHELTHVVQQSSGLIAGMQKKMTVNDPNDKYEAEADKVAEAVVSNQGSDVQREVQIEGVQRAEEEEVQMQEEQEEEEEVQAKADESIQREEGGEEEEEEEVQAKADESIQREEGGEEEEEEEVQAKADESIQREEEAEEEEEEEVQAKADETVQRAGEEGEEEENKVSEENSIEMNEGSGENAMAEDENMGEEEEMIEENKADENVEEEEGRDG